MTSIAHRYADFSPFGSDGKISDPVPLDRVEDQKLQSFEEGYQAGWTDAETNHTTEQKDIANEILDTLRDLSFTYHEALGRLNRGLRPMFEQVMSTLLPQTAGAALRAHVIEQLLELAGIQTGAQITIRVSEANLPMFEQLLEGVVLDLPVSLSIDATLGKNQLFIALDTVEREINLDAVCQEITSALNAFNFHSQPEHPDA
jgi:flagellar assembly protein FliH